MAQLKLSNSFTLKIKLSDGEGYVTFRKPKANSDIKPQIDSSDPNAWSEFVAGQVVSIEGIVNEDGTAVTKEQIQRRDIPLDLWAVLVHGYIAGVAKPQTKEAAEKKFELLNL